MDLPQFVVFGSRHFDDVEAVFSALDRLVKKHGPIAIVEGGASGADQLACEWARARSMWRMTYPADWQNEGRAAGPKRNARMAAHKGLTGGVAFPGGAGTADMAKRLEGRNLRVWWPVGKRAEKKAADYVILFADLLRNMKPEDNEEWAHRLGERIAILCEGRDPEDAEIVEANRIVWTWYMSELRKNL